jgi:hypothetical protein
MGTYKEDLNQKWQDLHESADAGEAVEKTLDLAGELGKGAVAVAGVGATTYGGLILGFEVAVAVSAGIAAAPVAVPVMAACVGLGCGAGFFATESVAERYFNADTADRKKVEDTLGKAGKVYGYFRSGQRGLQWLKEK